MYKRQGSVDASKTFTEPHRHSPMHEPFSPLERRPYTASRQPHHHRALTEDSQRPSRLQLRARSNTSTLSSPHDALLAGRRILSPASPSASGRPASRRSIDRRSITPSFQSRVERSESFGKALMAKGSKLLRRSNSKSDLTSLGTLESSEEFGQEPRRGPMQGESAYRPKSRPTRMKSKSDDMLQRVAISEPFNFQHLTHTDPIQFRRMQEAAHNDIVSEFSAMRASQAPRRELRGIKAEAIQRKDFALEPSSSKTPSPSRTARADSPPANSPRSTDTVQHALYSPSSPDRSVYKSRSVDNFSQPSPASYKGPPSPRSPPPRTSSRYFAPEAAQYQRESPNDPDVAPSTSSDSRAGLPDYPVAAWSKMVHDFSAPHAVTTPDDAAQVLRPPPFGMVKTELAQVLEEEDESSEGRRSMSTLRPTTASAVLRHSRSSPNIRRYSQRCPDTLLDDANGNGGRAAANVRPSSSLALSPSIEQPFDDIPIQRQASKRISVANSGVDVSWEDDIDWCYQHEAEADCNFDWDRSSIPDEELTPKTATEVVESAPGPDANANEKKSPPRRRNTISNPRSSSVHSSSPLIILPPQSSVPDLDPPSAVSAQSSFSSVSEAVTPSQASATDLPTSIPPGPSKQELADRHFSASLLLPIENASPAIYDDLYQEYFSRRSLVDPQYPFSVGRLDGSTVSSNSPRSSRSPISKSSSQESFWVRHHGNTSSAGSLPDLVYSKTGHERFGSTVDRSADLMALPNTVDIPIDNQQVNSQRRRSPSLAKDVAQKSMLSKVMSHNASVEDIEVPLPLHPAFRESADSDAPLRCHDAPVPPMRANRMRSTSSAASFKSVSPRASRASYSLFPNPPTK